MEAIRIVLAAASSMLLVMMMIISSASASAELTDEATSLSSSATTDAASVTLHRSGYLFTMQFSIGDTEVSGIADTGSDLIWTNNNQWLLDDPPLMSCPASDNDGGITYPRCDGRLCTFEKEYGGGVVARGIRGEAKLKFGGGGSAASDGYTTPYPINFGGALIISGGGCEHNHHLSSSDDDDDDDDVCCKSNARSAVVGLNRGEKSLVKQLKLDNFSYCLPHHDHTSGADAKTMTTIAGQIKFNDNAAISGTTMKIKMAGPDTYPNWSSHYAVVLKNIRVGESKNRVVQVLKNHGCPSLNNKDDGFDDDDGAMIIDSGTSVTTLPVKVFKDVKKYVEELLKEKKEKNGEQLIKVVGTKCYRGKKYPEGMDSIVLDFCSEDTMERELEIPPNNYFLQDQKIKTAGGEVVDSFCLTFNSIVAENYSLLGAYQQQDMDMLFNIQQNTLSFAKRTACGQQSHATM